MEKEAEPRALATAGRPDAVHAVVPVAGADEGKSVGAGGDAFVDRADAVFEERSSRRRHRRLAVRLQRIRCKTRRIEEGHALVEDSRIAGGADIFRDDKGQPQQIVRATRAQSAAARLVPPVLHVAFDELPSGSFEQMRPREFRPREQQCHDVLQLVAEAVRAARLVVTRARPEPAAHVLIDEPAVHQDIKRIVWRADLDGVERLVPRGFNIFERSQRAVDGVVTSDEPVGLVCIRTLAQQKQHTPLFSRLEDDLHMQRGARIQAGAKPRLERQLPQCGRTGNGSVAADERQAMAGRGYGRLARMHERDALREFVAVRISRVDRAARRVVGRRDVPSLALSRRPEHPVVVRHETQRSRLGAVVSQREQRELHRILDVHEHVELVADAARRSGETRDSRGVMDDELSARRLPRHRPRRRRPRIARVVVADEEGLGGRIDDGIVGERGQPVFPAVLRPRVRGARLCDDGAKPRVGDDVRPRHRGFLIALQDDRVAAPVG